MSGRKFFPLTLCRWVVASDGHLHVISWLVPQATTIIPSSHNTSRLPFSTNNLLQAAKVAKVSARAAPSVTVRFYVTTSRVLPSPLSAVSLAVVVLSVSRLWSTKKPVVSSRPSSNLLSVTPSPTPNTPSVRPSPRWTWSTPSSAKAVPCTVSVVRLLLIGWYCLRALSFDFLMGISRGLWFIRLTGSWSIKDAGIPNALRIYLPVLPSMWIALDGFGIRMELTCTTPQLCHCPKFVDVFKSIVNSVRSSLVACPLENRSSRITCLSVTMTSSPQDISDATESRPTMIHPLSFWFLLPAVSMRYDLNQICLMWLFCSNR